MLSLQPKTKKKYYGKRKDYLEQLNQGADNQCYQGCKRAETSLGKKSAVRNENATRVKA